MSAFCSYLELSASVTTPTMQYDKMTYRLYLGSNEVNDFSIRRGTTYNLEVDFNSNAILADEWTVVEDGPSKQIGGLKILSQMHGIPVGTSSIYLSITYIESPGGKPVGGLMEGSPKYAVIYATHRDLLETMTMKITDSEDGKRDPNIRYSIYREYMVSSGGLLIVNQSDEALALGAVTFYPAIMVKFETDTPVTEGATGSTKYTYATHFEFTTFDGVSSAGIDLYTYTKPYPISLKYYDGTVRFNLSDSGPHPDWFLINPYLSAIIENPVIYFKKNGTNVMCDVRYRYPEKWLLYGNTYESYDKRRFQAILKCKETHEEVALEDGIPFGNYNCTYDEQLDSTDVFSYVADKIYSYVKDVEDHDFGASYEYYSWYGYNYIPMCYTSVNISIDIQTCVAKSRAIYGKHWVLTNYREGESSFSYSNENVRRNIEPFTTGSDGFALYTYPSLYDMRLPFTTQLAPKDVVNSQMIGPSGYPQAWNITLTGYYRRNMFIQFSWGPIGPIKMIDNVALYVRDEEGNQRVIPW